MRNWLKTLLFLSVFSPALASIAAARYWGTHEFTSDIAYYALAGIAGCCLTLLILQAILKYGEEFTFNAKKIESNDALMIGIIITYFVPFMGKASEITVSVVLLF